MIHSSILSAASSNRPLKYITTKLDNNTDLKSLSTNIDKFRIDPFESARTIKNFLNFWTLEKLSIRVEAIFENKNDEVEDLDSITISQEVRDEFEFNYY